jgi:uncharacterized membrane protein YgaE (UPF0421/DUF939 family)
MERKHVIAIGLIVVIVLVFVATTNPSSTLNILYFISGIFIAILFNALKNEYYEI